MEVSGRHLLPREGWGRGGAGESGGCEARLAALDGPKAARRLGEGNGLWVSRDRLGSA